MFYLSSFQEFQSCLYYWGKNRGYHNLCGLKEINLLSLRLLDCFHLSLIFSTVSLTINQKKKKQKKTTTNKPNLKSIFIFSPFLH